jgi:uncharacterized LabA/DUF88 family protein
MGASPWRGIWTGYAIQKLEYKVTGAMGSAERVAAYVDGFNLYHGLHEGGRRYLWLDLEGLVRSLLRPGQQLVAVRYFTARVRNNPGSEQRQTMYLKALAAHSSMLDIRYGRFQEKSVNCRKCARTWTTYEEKESDVALAVSVVADGLNDLFDTALIVSADSDMAPAIRELRASKPEVRVIAALPPNRNSNDLRAHCDATFSIGIAKIRQAQLPETVMDGPYPITRPDYWK